MQKNLILAICSFIFLLLGLVTAAIGPILPELAQNAGVSLSSIGLVFTAIFLGALVAQLVAGPLGDKIGQRMVILGGLLLLATGLLGIIFSRSLPVMLAFAFISGVGHGGVDLGENVFIALVFNGKSVSALNILNLFFGLGAFAGPALVSFSLQEWNNGLMVLWLSLALIVLSVGLVLAMKVKDGQGRPAPAPAGKSAAASRRSVYRSPILWALGLLILVYVGTENGMGGWTTTYMQRTAGMNIEAAALVAAWFWLAITAGRMVSAGLGLRLSSINILFISLAGAVAGSALMAASTGVESLSIAGVLLIGFSFGAIYPTVMATVTNQFQEEPGKAVSVVAAMGSIGGSLLPWAQGVALENLSVTATAWFAVGGSVVMLALILVIRARLNSARRVSAQPAAAEE